MRVDALFLLCLKQVKGYPTLKVYAKGESKPHKGARDLKSLTDFIKDAAAELA
jgi:hypothetical protein